MMGRLNAILSGVLVLALAVIGCGSSSSTSSTSAQSANQSSSNAQTTTGAQTTSQGAPSEQASATTARTEHVPIASLQISSSAFKAGSAIPARYTCDGADISPPLKWGAIPKGTVELVLSIVALERKAPGGGPLVSWIVAGLPPGLKSIAPGKLPASAIVGRNSVGQTRYTICPRKGGPAERYIVALYALQHRVSLKPGFPANKVYTTVVHTAAYEGLTGFSYKRG